MIAGLRQHLRIAVQLMRIGVLRKSQFRIEFWTQVIMDCCWYGAHVAVFEVLYSHVGDVAGWSREEFRVLLAFLFVSDAFMMIWLGQMWRFWRDLKDGKLDPFRVRPAAPLFLYGFQQFSVEGCVNMTIALAYLGFAVERATEAITPGIVALTLLAILLSFWVRTVLLTMFATIDIWLLGSDVGRFLHETLHATADRPVDIFEARVRAFLLYIVPVGALTSLPAGIVLGRLDALGATLATTWLVVLGLVVVAGWNASFRRYESAMG